MDIHAGPRGSFFFPFFLVFLPPEPGPRTDRVFNLSGEVEKLFKGDIHPTTPFNKASTLKH
jgi:hypothetical protein